jgi:ABC-type nitrate/sulfonate/bicarbonate transport system permease component
MFLPALITASVLIYASVFNSPDVTFSKGTLSVFAMLCGSTTFAVVTAIISDFAISGKFFGIEVFSVKGSSSDNNRFVGLIILAFTAALVKHIVNTANRKSGRGRTERKGE